MTLIKILQWIQLLFGFCILGCLFHKKTINSTKNHFIVCLTILVFSILIIPPIGRNYVSAVTMQ